VLRRWDALGRPKFRDFAPYAAYVSRLDATFAMGVSTGVVTTRRTNVVDLEYLFYAPFTMAFCSADRFHETLWPATTGRNTFLHGIELKADLRDRHQRNLAVIASGQKFAQCGIHPPRVKDSVITKVCDLYLIAEEELRLQGEQSPRKIDELDQQTQSRLKKAFEEIDKRRGV
jgi:hypothetical protein